MCVYIDRWMIDDRSYTHVYTHMTKGKKYHQNEELLLRVCTRICIYLFICVSIKIKTVYFKKDYFKLFN